MHAFLKPLTLIFVFGLGIPFLPTQVRALDEIEAAEKEKFNRLAKELIESIQRVTRAGSTHAKTEAAKNYFKKPYAFVPRKRLRIALMPFQKAKIPLSKEIADQFNEMLLASLFDHAKGQFEFIARDALKTIISDLQETGGLDAAHENPIATLMTKARKIDLLIKGKMRLDGRKISLTYKAVQTDGAIVGQTKPAKFFLKERDVRKPSDLLTLDQVVENAAQSLASRANDLTELRLGGIHFQNTGLQPEFGRFLVSKLRAALEKEFSNVVSGGGISVVEPRLQSRLRGIVVEEKQLRDENLTDVNTSYLLSGKYWILGNFVDLLISLVNRQNKSVSWNGRMGIAGAATLSLRPAGDFEPLRENDGLGPFKFKLTSAKGLDPRYRIGENLNLIIRTDEDAWVYCFYKQANGEVIQIFPNPYFWKRFKSPLLRAKIAHTVPGQEIFPFDLKITPPAGRELVKCFAASRDITKELPKALRGRTLSPLPQKLVKHLSESFRSMSHTGIGEASLVVTVVQP